ncbi:MAG: ATP-binding protein [Candidatus Aminicenantes bacterium]|nr:MAG: ATP-binding protein [Candidatus Aminicenantes bacterium]
MNPFVYGEKVSGENFCNREQEIKELVSEISSGQNIMIYSPRRYGKTSLMSIVLTKVEEKGLIPLYIDLFPVMSNEDFVRISLKAISLVLSRSSKNLLKKVKTFFKHISPSLFLTVAEDGTPSIGINFSKAETLPALEDIFNGFCDFIKEKKKRGVVVFDEFQQVGELEDTRIEKTLRGIIQNHREISYVFMGSKKHLIYDMFNNPERPFYKSSAHFPLKKIDPGPFSDFIRKKFIKSNISIDEVTAEYIVNTAAAHPHYTQLLAHMIWEYVSAPGKIGFEQVDKAVNRIIEREEAAFTNLWDNLTLHQKKLLLSLSLKKDSDKIFSAEYVKQFNLSSTGTVQRGIKSLLNKGIIDKNGEKIEINDVFLKLWLIKKMSYSIRQNF